MTRKYRVVADVEQATDAKTSAPSSGDHCEVWNSGVLRHTGTITEVTPILSAEEALDQIEEDMEKDFLSYEEHFRRAKETIARHRASQEKPLCSTCHRPAHPDAPLAC